MPAEISRDPWATLDEILGVEPVVEVDEGSGPVAFYGRCSIEDNQDRRPPSVGSWVTRASSRGSEGR
ncbi:hypothetical protein [Actinophytocola xanthii]|uniref:hypothetical protein n=1 Tax=Actinophytocola xanthii TaxID=1912961 RepID=UPI000A5AE403|nr:hypothetical protein [Actinophytocola xanthii]